MPITVDFNEFVSLYNNPKNVYQDENKKMKEENEKLKKENEELKEERDRYFGYLKDKDLECEEQRERAELLSEKIDELKEEIKKLKENLHDYAFAFGDINEELEKHRKSEEENTDNQE